MSHEIPDRLPRDGVVIRTAVIADAGVLADTIVACFEQYRGLLTPDSGALRETALGIERELTAGASAFIVELHGAILGCVMVREVDGDLYFGRLSVLPAARGRGVARLLTEAVEDEAHRRGAAGTRLSVRIALPENQDFFASMGYAETAREAHPGFAHPTFITMRKPLGSNAPLSCPTALGGEVGPG